MTERNPTKAELLARLQALEQELEGLSRRAAEAEAKRDEYLEDLRRVAADFENYRKRAVRDQESLVARAHERLAKALLPVLDDLERALEVGTANNLEAGVRLVERQLGDTLAKEGLVEIATDGRFDPHVHEALLTQPSEAEEGAIIQVLQKGYRLGDRVLRPARVVISQGVEEAQTTE
jgi:molecular chaperone GrpE